MCGLTGIIIRDGSRWRDSHEEKLDNSLRAIARRGWEATGILAVMRDGRLILEKASCDATTFCRNRVKLPADTVAVLGHTRASTQGHPAFDRNNHPIESGSVYLTHNGWVNNEMTLRRKAENHGVDSYAEVDSESVAMMLAAFPKTNLLTKFEGAGAFVWYDTRNETVTLAVCTPDSTPLHVCNSRRAFTWASYAEVAQKLQPDNGRHSAELKRGMGIRISLFPHPRQVAFSFEWREPVFEANKHWVYRGDDDIVSCAIAAEKYGEYDTDDPDGDLFGNRPVVFTRDNDCEVCGITFESVRYIDGLWLCDYCEHMLSSQ